MIVATGLVAVFGLIIGSFLNVVIHRLPRGESVVRGRSHCPACGRTLAWYDLVPVVSYLALRGRCRSCGAPISPRYPLVELLTGAVFAALFYRFGPTPVLIKYLFLASILVAAAFIDLEHYIIPNRLVLVGAGGGLLSPLLQDVSVWSALSGMAVAGGVLLLLALVSKGGMGLGDVKLAAVVGLFLGWPLGLVAVFFAACLGGAFGILLLVFGIKRRKDPIPFGPFIALGTVVTLLWGKQVVFWYTKNFW